jgi:hypothetical protein
MENGKQTAVEWFYDKLENHEIQAKHYDLFQQAKQMEKEQINKAWENGFMSTGEGWNGEIPPECHGQVLDTEQYYNETYGK